MSTTFQYFTRCLRDANLVVGHDALPLELARQFLHLEVVATKLDASYRKPSTPLERLQYLENFVLRRNPKTPCAAFARARGLLPAAFERLLRYLAQPQRTLAIPETALLADWVAASTTYPEEACGSGAAARFVTTQLSQTYQFHSEVRVVLYGCAEPSQVPALVRAVETAAVGKEHPSAGGPGEDLVTLKGAVDTQRRTELSRK